MFVSGSCCHRLGLDRIDDHMINITPNGYLIKLSCILLLILQILLSLQICAVLYMSTASMSQSTDICFSCNGRSLIETKTDRSQDRSLWYTVFY